MCACLSVLVIVCVFECVFECACSPSICVRENLYLHFLDFVCMCACVQQGRHVAHKFKSGWE